MYFLLLRKTFPKRFPFNTKEKYKQLPPPVNKIDQHFVPMKQDAWHHFMLCIIPGWLTTEQDTELIPRKSGKKLDICIKTHRHYI